MTKLIVIAIVIIVAIGGWNLYEYWIRVSEDQAKTEQQSQASATLDPHSLPGMPEKGRDKLEDSLAKAQARGAAGYRDWLNVYRKSVQDPRLAWIELDYAVLLAQSNPAEAKKVFAAVQDRIPPTSPVYPRVKQLAKTFE